MDGGARRDRTDDLKLAKLALSQLSYGPVFEHELDQMVGPERVERSTSRLSGVRSNHLSYEPDEVQQTPCARIARAFDRRKGNEGGGKTRRLSSEYRETA